MSTPERTLPYSDPVFTQETIYTQTYKNVLSSPVPIQALESIEDQHPGFTRRTDDGIVVVERFGIKAKYDNFGRLRERQISADSKEEYIIDDDGYLSARRLLNRNGRSIGYTFLYDQNSGGKRELIAIIDEMYLTDDQFHFVGPSLATGLQFI
jgi:hypothetical protein